MDKKLSTLENESKTMTEIYHLMTSKLVNYLDESELNMMLTHSKIVFFSPGDIIFQQGKMAESVYIILYGSACITTRIMGEGIKNIETLGPGYFLGEVSFISKGPCSTSAIAHEKMTCLSINNTYFELLAVYFPETRYKIMQAMTLQVCGRLKQVHDQVAEFIQHSDMVSLSFFGRVIHSLTQPKKIPLSACGININQFKKSILFSSFNPDEIEELFDHTMVLESSKNCILIHESKKSSSCYIVLQGAVQSSIMIDNKIAKLSVIGPCALFSSIGCIEQNSSFTITFITCEPAILMKIPEEELLFFKHHKPQLWYKLFNLICESIVALGKSIDKLDVRLHIETYNR